MKTSTLILLGLALVVAGCSATTEGIVNVRTELAVGSTAPDISFRAPDGKETSLYRERLLITIVAFVTPSGTDCSKLEPELTGLTPRFVHLPVSVVQVSLPTANCPQGPGCVQVSGTGRRDVLAICDRERLAWNNYLEPKPGTVFLIDKNGMIVMTGTLRNIGPLADRAVEMGQDVADLHHGGWSGQY